MGVSGLAGLGSGLFAICAAGLWFLSAFVKLPEIPDDQTPNRANASGFRTQKAVLAALRQQGKLSAAAAGCAAVAALLQVVSAYTTP